VVQDGKIELVDEFTGRIMPHRTLQVGLHQAIEAREGLEISLPSVTSASLSFQRYFRCYPRLSGVSGTAAESRKELWHIYHLAVVLIPTHRPGQRRVLPPLYRLTRAAKWQAVVTEITTHHQAGRAVLVGTRSIEDSEELGALMLQTGLEFRILNAVRHREEAEIIALAGQPGRITIATNMAGRGTDIELHPDVKKAGGLHVIATEHHESGRIDRQLFGRSARQGDPGSAQAILSLEDDLLRRYLPAMVLRRLKANPNQVSPRVLGWVYTYAQASAERQAFRMRRNILRQDIWLDEHLSFSGKSSPV
jgi:preprotein translocase subunit SecA